MATINVSVVESLNLNSPGTGGTPSVSEGLGINDVGIGILPKVISGLQFDGVITSPLHGIVTDSLIVGGTTNSNIKITEITLGISFTETIDTVGSIIANPDKINESLVFSETIVYNRDATRSVITQLGFKSYQLGYVKDTNILIREYGLYSWDDLSWAAWDVLETSDLTSVEIITMRRDQTYSPITSLGSRFEVMRAYYGLSETGEVTLACGPLSVILRSPIFNNTQSIHQTRIQRESISGKLIIYRDQQWPQTETFHWSFEALTETQRDDFLDFIYSTLGLQVTVSDYEGRDWLGIISNPEVETSQVSRGCGYTVNLEFEGEIIE